MQISGKLAGTDEVPLTCFTRNMSKRSLYIAAYDIRAPRRLRRMLRVLKNYATGGQKSVFECFLTPQERKELLERVSAEMLSMDRFLLVRLDPRSRIEVLGIAIRPADPDFYYIG